MSAAVALLVVSLEMVAGRAEPRVQVAPGSGEASAAQAASGISPEDAQRWRAYHDEIVRRGAALPRRASLVDLLGPVLRLAAARSADGNARDENRAALMALTFYVNGWPVEGLVPVARDWPRADRRTLVLRGRHDLAQHFVVSALIAAAAGAPIAQAAGLYKEISDSRRSSGFSFSDLAADHAGTRFGDLATASIDSARRLQARAGSRLEEADVMPSIDGLADNLSEAEFRSRYGRIGTPAYQDVVALIARRVAALPLFQTGS